MRLLRLIVDARATSARSGALLHCATHRLCDAATRILLALWKYQRGEEVRNIAIEPRVVSDDRD